MIKEQTTSKKGKRRLCPNCGSQNVVPMIYGLPGPELIQEQEEGKVELGGCLISEDNPRRCCKDCRHRW